MCAADGGGWTTHAHAAPLPRFDREPTTLLVAAPALRQTNTNAKDVAWPATRAAYDDVKRRMTPEGIGEIILTPDGGATLLEGLTTNLFVVRTRVDMPYHGVADGEELVGVGDGAARLGPPGSGSRRRDSGERGGGFTGEGGAGAGVRRGLLDGGVPDQRGSAGAAGAGGAVGVERREFE